jgi:thiol-disulfide isomerase/thioredoxin
MPFLPEAVFFLVLVALLVVFGCWCAPSRFNSLESIVLPPLVALGGFALLLQIVGTVFGLRATVLSLLVFPVLGWWLWRSDVRDTSLLHRRLSALPRFFRHADWLNRTLMAYLLLVCSATFVWCLVPPSAGDYDSLVYHLATPRQYWRAGQIGELAYDHHTYFPFTLEMWFLSAMQLRPDIFAGAVLAKLFHWLMLPVCCGALIAFGQRHLTLRVGLLAAVLFASIPIVLNEALTAYIDLGYSAFTLLAFFTFATWMQTRERSWLLWSAVCVGFCLGTKYLGALTFGWLGLWLLGISRQHELKVVRPALGFALVSLALGGWWYARNILWTGSPVFPFAYEIFGGRGWTAQMAKAYAADQASFGFDRSPLDILWLPWRMSMTPLNIGVSNAGQIVGLPFWPLLSVGMQDTTRIGFFEVRGLVLQTVLGPALLAFGVPFLFLRDKPALVKFCAWSFAFYFVFWTFTGQYLRYLLPAFAFWCVPCAWAIQRFEQRRALVKWPTLGLLAAWAMFAIFFVAHTARSAFGVIGGQEKPEAYLSRTFGGFDAMQWASQNTPANAKFAVWGEPRNYYLDRDYFWADDPHNNLIDYSKVLSPADLTRELQRLGATHVLINTRAGENGGVFGPPETWAGVVAAGLASPIFKAKGYEVYQLNGQTTGGAR